MLVIIPYNKIFVKIFLSIIRKILKPLERYALMRYNRYDIIKIYGTG